MLKATFLIVIRLIGNAFKILMDLNLPDLNTRGFLMIYLHSKELSIESLSIKIWLMQKKEPDLCTLPPVQVRKTFIWQKKKICRLSNQSMSLQITLRVLAI